MSPKVSLRRVRLFDELSSRMPDELDIDGFEFDANQGREGDTVELRARAEIGRFF